MTRTCVRIIAVAGLVSVSVGLAGCTPEFRYVTSVVKGEAAYLDRAVPIEEALDDPELTEDQRARLQFVIQARDFAEQVIGLNVGSSYRTFVNLHGQTLAWNLSASRVDALEPYVWNLPFVGAIPYLGYFNRDEAVAERDRLLGLGYDTMMYEVDAFSTLGLLPDPVSSALLTRTLPNLADTVVHEATHNTIWHADTNFAESLATFVGRTGAMDFIEVVYGADSSLLTDAVNEQEDGDRLNAFLRAIRDEVAAVYAQGISSEEKVAQREVVFEQARQRFTAEVQPLLHNPQRYAVYGTIRYTNAFLLVNVRYNSDLQVFKDVHARTGEDWAATINVFRQAAGTSDPYGYLRSYLQPQ